MKLLILSVLMAAGVAVACSGNEPASSNGEAFPAVTGDAPVQSADWTTEVAQLPPGLGVSVDVWVYDERAPTIDLPCSMLLDNMVPVTYRMDVEKEVAHCLSDISSDAYAEYRIDPGGTYYLDHVLLLLQVSPDMPEMHGNPACDEIERFLLSTALVTDPSELIYPNVGLVQCAWVPRPPELEGGAGRSVWGALTVSTPAQAIPAGTRCVTLLKYLGPPRGAVTRPQACLLD